MSINAVAISGRLGHSPEVKQTRGGTSVVTLRVCVNGRRKDGSEWVDDPNWVDVVAFGGMADACGRHLSKGSFVCVHGRLSQRTWEARDGSKRSQVEVVATEVDFGPRQGGAGSATGSASPSLYDDDVPF